MFKKPSIYFIMGTANVKDEEPLTVLEDALQAGITHFQLREKGKGALVGSELVAFAQACKRLCKIYGVPFIVNDDVELALSVQADGIHLGQGDWKEGVKEVITSKGMVLGRSVHTMHEAEDAIRSGADYLGVGSVFPTLTKPDAEHEVGASTSLIREVHECFPNIPVIGIGGIEPSNVHVVWEAGATGVAVISCICKTSDRREVISKLSPPLKIERRAR